MGLFLNVAIVHNCMESNVNTALKRIEQNDPSLGLSAAACQCKESGQGVQILLNESCIGYDNLAKTLSEETGCPVLLLYIYDEDFWGYYFYEGGRELDRFNPMPDYFGEVSPEEKQRLAGNSGVIAQHFHIDQGSINHYLIEWPEELLDSAHRATAYANDEFPIGEPWQIADFMRKLGYPYLFDKETAPDKASENQAVVERSSEKKPSLKKTPDDQADAEKIPGEKAPSVQASSKDILAQSHLEEKSPSYGEAVPKPRQHGRAPVLAAAVVTLLTTAGSIAWFFMEYATQRRDVLPAPIGIGIVSACLTSILWRKYIRTGKQVRLDLKKTLK